MNRKAKFQLPPRGVYTLRAPESFSQANFRQSKTGNLVVKIDPTVADGPHAGFQIRRQEVSAKVFERNGESASKVGDYLMALGFKGRLDSDQAVADAVEATAGKTYEADLDWRAENYRTNFKLEGMNKFPKLADGTYQQWIDDPTETDAEGRPMRLFANIYIRNFIPARD